MTRLLRPLVVSVVCVAGILPFAATAEDASGLKVLGIAVKPAEGDYLVLKDVNVRAKPDNNAKRVAKLSNGDKVEAVGRVKGPWYAVRQRGKVLGFVYGGILMPVVDGTLSEPVTGKIELAVIGRCEFAVEFVGKSEAEPQRVEFADYAVQWRCTDPSGQKLQFTTPMFLSEGPYQGTRAAVHQITVDVLELAGGLEEVFSTHLLWDRDAKQIKYDSATEKKFIHAKPPAPQPAKTLAEALRKAVDTAAQCWTEAVWVALAKKPESR
ncbi:MAG: SH3 domain-containing protein [Rhodospirillaceae bacterium]